MIMASLVVILGRGIEKTSHQNICRIVTVLSLLLPTLLRI